MIQFEILSGKEAGKTIPVSRLPFTIGRSSQCDLSLAEPGVWDRHLTVQLVYPKGFTGTLQDEALGTLNEKPFTSSHLRNGDVLGLGSLRLGFSLSGTRSKGLRAREWMTWIAFAAIFAAQIFLIYLLPG